MTYCVSTGTLNPTHSTNSVQRVKLAKTQIIKTTDSTWQKQHVHTAGVKQTGF